MPSFVARVACLAFAAVLLSSTAYAGHRVANRTYMQSGPDGVFYARCTPAAEDGSAGRTEIFSVGAAEDRRVDRYDWYAKGGVTLGWSPIAGKVAVMAVIAEPRPGGGGADAWRDQEELRFAIGGKVLRSFTVGELLALGADEVVSRPAGRHANYRVVGCLQVPGTNEYDFVIEVAGGTGTDGTRLKFDITTGQLRPDRPRVPIGPGDQAEAVRVAKAFMANTHPRLDVGDRPPAATHFADVGGKPMWVVTFRVAAEKGPDGKVVGVRPSYAFDVRLRPDGEVEGTIAHMP